jgi:hypothetical protein
MAVALDASIGDNDDATKAVWTQLYIMGIVSTKTKPYVY